MSWAASAWAKQAGRLAGKALNPALRYLLVCVADRTNDDTGYTYASPRCLSEDVGNSVDSIKEGLRRLESMGYLARVRRLKPNGSHDTSLIILLRDDEAHAKAAELGWAKPADGAADEAGDDAGDEGGPAGDEAQDVGGWGENHPHPPTEGVGGNGPPGWGENHPHPIDEPEKGTLIPPTPSRVRGPVAPSADQALGMVASGLPARALPEGYDPDVAGANAFLAEWRSSGGRASVADVPEVVRQIWRKLSAADRRRARADLDAWIRQMQREKQGLGSATRYLRTKAWEVLDHVRAGRRDGTSAAVFWIRAGSPEWQSWERHEARHGRRMAAYRSRWDQGEGRHMPSLWPPREPGGGAPRDEDPAEVARLLAGE